MLRLNALKGPGFGPVDARVKAGVCLAIVGESGSGKTRLLRAIADLDPVEGECSLNDTSRNQIPATDWRKRVAYVPSEPGWWAPMPGDHFIDLATCKELAGVLGIDDKVMQRPVEHLSTGERQRLALVRALQFDPEVLLLDEPTGPLDSGSTERVEAEIIRRLSTGVGVILVSHDLAQAKRLGKDVFVMDSGKLSRFKPEGEAA